MPKPLTVTYRKTRKGWRYRVTGGNGEVVNSGGEPHPTCAKARRAFRMLAARFATGSYVER